MKNKNKYRILKNVTDTNFSIDYRTIEEVLAENLNKQNIRFVFPSSVALETWSDWAVKNTRTRAVALQNWLAWDDFKQRFAQVQKTAQNCIPETLRKLFVRSLISDCTENNFLFPLIPNAQNGEPLLHFTNWLASLLPSLKRWYEKSVEVYGENFENMENADAEDKAFFQLYARYTKYLEENKLFDPAWVESQQITRQFKFIIFHPEQLKDFGDFKDCILQSDCTLVCLPPLAGTENFLQEQNIEVDAAKIEKNTKTDATAKIECILYPNARKELRRTVLKIRQLNQKGTNWHDIALTVSNLDQLRPYIERELTNYCVPYVIRSGGSLTQNCAGRIFEEIASCAESKFNFESLSAILQDGFVPYKYQTLNNEIVRIALESRSLCEYKNNNQKIDPLEEVLKNRSFDQNTAADFSFAENVENADFESLFANINAAQITPEQKIARQALVYYKTLKHKIHSIYRAKTFKAIKDSWGSFEEQFLQGKDWQNDKDHIVGICISTLAEFIEIEKTYAGDNGPLKVPRPFDFFLEEIKQKRYMPQNSKTRSISVFDYRAAADCNFEYHFIINANQKALTVPFSELAFLNERKRQQLGAANNDSASITYIRLYAKAGSERSFFSCSTSGFEGFCISHTFFEEYNIAKQGDKEAYLDESDFFINEKRYLIEENCQKPAQITRMQAEAMEKWQKSQQKTRINEDFANRQLVEKAKKSLHYGKDLPSAGSGEKFEKITQTDLSQFFPCPRNWIFRKVLKLKEESQTAQILQHYDFGTICHKIVENIFNACGVLDFAKMKACIPEATQKALTEKDEKTKADDIKNSDLATQMLLAQKGIFENYIEKFLAQICSAPECTKDGKVKPSGKFENYTVLGTEKSFNQPINANYSLYGQIDAIISGDAEQGDVILDYKTGSLPDPEDCVPDDKEKLNDFQMAVYSKLLLNAGTNGETGKNSPYNLQNALFYSLKLSDDKFKTNYVVDANAKEEDRKDIESFEETAIALLDKYLDIFMQNVDAGNFEPQFSFDPKNSDSRKTLVRPFVDCAACKYKEICRTSFATAGTDLN